MALFYLEDSAITLRESLRRKAGKLALFGLRTFIQNRCRLVATKEGPLDRLVRSIDDHTLVVSFNWDVLLELALLRAGRNYCYLPSKHSRDAVVLLKPHGSINWFALLDRELLKISGGSNLGLIGGDLTHYLCYLEQPLKPVDFSACSSFVQSALSTVPAIVAPTASKLLLVGCDPRDGFVEDEHPCDEVDLEDYSQRLHADEGSRGNRLLSPWDRCCIDRGIQVLRSLPKVNQSKTHSNNRSQS